MKNAKKLVVLLLALVMVFALPVTAFAAGGTYVSGRSPEEKGTITINNAAVGETYSIYKILDYDLDTKTYTVNDTWAGWLKTQGEYVSIGGDNTVTWVENADAAAFAKEALAYAVDYKIEAAGTEKAEAETLKFSNLELGYYLISSSKGPICALVTTDPNGVINEKNETPTLVKEVQEDSDESWGKVNDADIGQEVNFQITVTAQPGAENYVVHDVMDSAFNFNSKSVSVTVGGKELSVGDGYSVNTSTNDRCAFEVIFDESVLEGITESTEIVITYSATFNEETTGKIGYPEVNKSWLSYGDGSTTPPDETYTYTWNFDILKYGDGDETKRLAGAQFVLLNSDESAYAIIEDGVVIGWDYISGEFVAKDGKWSEESILTTDENGSITISGLDGGTYYLREIAAPEGYNLLTDYIEVTIAPTKNDDGTLTLTPVVVKVNNNSGPEMPSTGGIGTTIFYAAGTVLVLGAAVLLIVKKRMSIEK